MTKVQAKLRKSTVPGKAGRIYYRICHCGQVRHVTTDMRLFPHQWDERLGRVVAPDDDAGIAVRIGNDLRLLRNTVVELEAEGAPYSAADIAQRFRTSASRVSVLEYMERRIEHLTVHNRHGTARNYRRAKNSLASFLGGGDIAFCLLDERVVADYGDWLADRRVVRNTVSFYMRIWRAVYNKAVDEKIVEQSFPFRNVYTGIDRTRTRAADERIVLKLLKLDLSSMPALALSRDLFVFSYCTRGMAFVDMAFLRKRDIDEGSIYYCRQKTGRLLNVRIEPCTADILSRYESATAGSEYVFPIITSGDPEIAYRQYGNALGCHNRRLKELARMIGERVRLTSYTARHTWATAARNHNVPVSVISAGMGHSSERTTLIYLESLENTVIDAANHGLLADLNEAVSS